MNNIKFTQQETIKTENYKQQGNDNIRLNLPISIKTEKLCALGKKINITQLSKDAGYKYNRYGYTICRFKKTGNPKILTKKDTALLFNAIEDLSDYLSNFYLDDDKFLY